MKTRVLPFVLMGLAIGATTFGIGLVANYSADEALRLSVSDIESDCDDLLGLLLHVNASELASSFAITNHVTREDLLRLSERYCIDEFSLVDKNGIIVETTDSGAKVGDRFIVDEQFHGPYQLLLDGRRTTVHQRFRPSATQSDRLLKYFGMALPNGGFMQIGYLWETFERGFPRYIMPIFEDRKVGENGFCVVIDARGSVEMDVPGHPEAKGMTAAAIGFTSANLNTPLGKIFRARLFGTLCRCMAYPDRIAGRRIFAAVPISEGQGPALALAFGVAFVLLAAFVVFRLVLRNFRLAQAKIDALRAIEEKHRADDLALAHSIQQAELRTDGTDGDGYHITSLMRAAREVGGDFYDYYELPDGRVVLTIADVSGKGIPAAFFMMKARTTLESCVYSSPSLAEAVAKANGLLAKNNPAEMFVTAWVGVFDPKTGVLDYVSAGHNPPLVRHISSQTTAGDQPSASSSVDWIAAPRCAALGVFEKAKYRSAQLTLVRGDRLFLYTDGVTEAMNESGELFGNERLEETLKNAVDDGALIPAVSAAVEEFVASAEQSDDITMLEMHFT